MPEILDQTAGRLRYSAETRWTEPIAPYYLENASTRSMAAHKQGDV